MPRESWRDAQPARPRSRDESPRLTGQREPRRVSELDTTPSELDELPDGLMYDAVMSMGEVERYILRADEELVKLTESHMTLARQAAEAKADWMAHLSRVLVRIAHSGEKGASDTREAMARTEIDPITGREGNDLYRTYKILTETVDAQARAMRAIESRLNGWQTIAANLRKVAM